MCNDAWVNLFPISVINISSRLCSDHSPIIGEFKKDMKFSSGFKFQNMWCLHADFLDVVKLSWSQASTSEPMRVFADKLKRLKHALTQWNTASFGNIHLKVKAAEDSLHQAELQLDLVRSDSTIVAYADAAARYRVVLAQEESFWAQKARQKWLKEGDRNTAFFQATVKERRQFSLCTSIRQDDSSYLTDLDRIASSGVDYFRAQFNAPHCASFTTLV